MMLNVILRLFALRDHNRNPIALKVYHRFIDQTQTLKTERNSFVQIDASSFV